MLSAFGLLDQVQVGDTGPAESTRRGNLQRVGLLFLGSRDTPPFGSKRHTRLRGRAWGDPIPMKGQTLWYSMHTINFYMCLFGDIRNSIHEKSHGIP